VKERLEAIMEETAKVVHHFILQEFLTGEDPGELTEGTPLITGGILDSIRTLKLVVFLEEHFDIRVEAYEAGVEHLDSIGQIAALVERKRAAA
jgi:acyl carrier protein